MAGPNPQEGAPSTPADQANRDGVGQIPRQLRDYNKKGLKEEAEDEVRSRLRPRNNLVAVILPDGQQAFTQEDQIFFNQYSTNPVSYGQWFPYHHWFNQY